MDLTELHLHWRQNQYKGKVYRSYSLARAYRENGKKRKHIVIKLGKLTEAIAQKWKLYLKAIKKPNVILTSLDDLYVSQHYAYLDIAVTNAIWDDWELDTIFPNNSKRTVPIAMLARILTVNRCIDPIAKSQTPEWFYHTAFPWLLNTSTNNQSINSSRIFRELTTIEQYKEQICKHLFFMITKRDPESMKSIFYDLSSTTFHGTCCVLMKWGHCKEGYQNHVVLALVVNRDGLPFYWEVLPGCTSDSKTITWLLSRLKKRFQIPHITLVFDRGMVSDDNLEQIEQDQIKYISAMDRNQIENITEFDFSKFSHFTPKEVDEQIKTFSDFTKLNNTTWYHEVKVENNRRYILCFNPQLFKDQQAAREQAILQFQAFVDDLNRELLEAKISRQYKTTYEKFKKRIKKAKLQSFVDINLNKVYAKNQKNDKSIQTYQAKVTVDTPAKQTAAKLDGFWLLVTNQTRKDKKNQFEFTAEDAIKPYREKVIIESAFRDIKSFIDIKPVYVWTIAHVKAHYSCCVLAYLINRILTIRLHYNAGKETKDIITHEKLYKILSTCQIDCIEIENLNLSTYKMTQLTSTQRELLQRVGLIELLKNGIEKKAAELK